LITGRSRTKPIVQRRRRRRRSMVPPPPSSMCRCHHVFLIFVLCSVLALALILVIRDAFGKVSLIEQEEECAKLIKESPAPPGCSRQTGGTCSISGLLVRIGYGTDCASWRGNVSCELGRCLCKEGFCADNDGVCHPQSYWAHEPLIRNVTFLSEMLNNQPEHLLGHGMKHPCNLVSTWDLYGVPSTQNSQHAFALMLAHDSINLALSPAPATRKKLSGEYEATDRDPYVDVWNILPRAPSEFPMYVFLTSQNGLIQISNSMDNNKKCVQAVTKCFNAQHGGCWDSATDTIWGDCNSDTSWWRQDGGSTTIDHIFKQIHVPKIQVDVSSCRGKRAYGGSPKFIFTDSSLIWTSPFLLFFFIRLHVSMRLDTRAATLTLPI